MTAIDRLKELGLLWGVDPKYHPAIFHAFATLETAHGEPTPEQLDMWFTVVYGMVLELEDVLECDREHVKKPMNYDDFLELPAEKPRVNVDDLKHRSRDGWDQYEI